MQARLFLVVFKKRLRFNSEQFSRVLSVMGEHIVGYIRKILGTGQRLAVVTALGTVPMSAQAESLADALVGAYTHSGLLEQNRALLRAADEDVASAGAALKPVLRWTANLTKTYSRGRSPTTGIAVSSNNLELSVNLIGSLLLYDFGASQFRIEATKETVLATRETLRAIEQQILLRAVSAYFGVVAARETVALRENNLRLLSQELKAARDRFEVGEVTRTDVALAEAQLAQARSGLAGAQGLAVQAFEEYRNVVGSKPGRLAPPPRLPRVGNDIKRAKGLAMRRHPQMIAAQHQVAAADLLIKSSEAAMKPTVTLNGSLGLSESLSSGDFGRSASIGVTAGQTLYAGGSLSSAVRRAMAQRDAQRGNLHTVRHDIAQEVGNAYAILAATQAQLAASEEQVRAARIAFRGVREEASLGARTTLDVLDAEQALLDASSALVSTRADLYVAAYRVIAATGQLTAVDLKLPVQIYDPAAYYNLVKGSPAKRSKQGEKLDRVLRALQKE